MNVLVTGSAGFIGSKVAEVLLAQRHAVLGIDNLNDAYDVRLKHWRLNRLRDWGQFRFAELDILHKTSLERLHGSFDAVINLAARAGVRQSVEDPWTYLDTNTKGTLNLLELCRSRGITKFVLASTSSLYGNHNARPFREDDNTDSLLSPYAASKKAAEVLCRCYHSLHGLDVAVLRYFTVYGPAGRPDMAPFRFVQRIYEGIPITVNGDGTQERDFTYVDDIALGTVSALRTSGFEVINLGGNQPVPLMELIHTIERTTGRAAVIQRAPAYPADMQATWADITRAKALLRWAPGYPLADGIAASVHWYEKNRAWAKDIQTTDTSASRPTELSPHATGLSDSAAAGAGHASSRSGAA